jgi:translation elongation factor EF-Tu-like GTPase
MIYSKKLLIIRILFESLRKKPVFGIYRPQAYLREAGSYCTTLRIEEFKKEIRAGEAVVMTAVLEFPVGYGKHLKPGALLRIRDGLDDVGKAIVLEIIGYEKKTGAEKRSKS